MLSERRLGLPMLVSQAEALCVYNFLSAVAYRSRQKHADEDVG